MEKLTITSAQGTIEISTKSAQYRLQSFSASPLVDTAQTSKGYKQEGYDFEAAFAEMRDFSVSFIVFGKGYNDLFAKRRQIKKLLNPKLNDMLLIYKNDYTEKEITVKVDAEPLFSTSKDNFGYHTELCAFTMTAYNPFWRDLSTTIVDMVGLSGGFYWDSPTYFEDKFYLGELSSALKTVYNAGDVPAPLQIEWTGQAENPKIELVDTGEYILLDKTLSISEKLIITTGYGEKNVFIEDGGNVTKDFSIVNPASTFFSLPVGNSTVALSADTGAPEASVRLKYKNLYSGV